MSARVIRIRDALSGWPTNPQYVYCGRAGKGLSGKYHVIGMCPCGAWHDRNGAVDAHAAEVRAKYEADPDYRAQIEFLRDKTLVCFCKPARRHADVYVEILEGRLTGRNS